MRNVEIKCELRDRARAIDVCRALGARRVGLLEQRDTYYRVAQGRLKRRESPGRADEWIVYERANDASARPSNYELLSGEEAAQRFDMNALSAWAVVEKRRTLWMAGEVRVHLDLVAGLGEFLELEALVNARQDETQAARELKRILRAFAPVLGATCSESYSDLLSSRAARSPEATAPSR
jgi:adenylate cyclase class IV